MLKRLWMIFGPVLIAGLLVFLLIFFYPTEMHHNLGAEKRSAVATTIDSFKERSQKVRALSDPNVRFVPFFGSSEWLRFDGAHPAVLAEKYNRSYRPYLLGQGGAASLNQYFGMQQMLPQLENKQVVYVISPQWFSKNGYDPAAFQQYFNGDQLTSFLKHQSGDQASQYAATRLLQQFPNVAMKDLVQKLASKEELSTADNEMIELLARFNERQASFFGQFKDGGEPFFMKDTIHLGWLGWLAFDKAVDPFLSNPTPAPTYHLNERFFSKDWATYDGDVKEFQ
ncbi:protein involved in D-alanine esterification of lipoteichoic acid and wall teichoic acid (D-alanine transfer protein) [Streptococcus pneumoniae]|uniref:D-alanyl-lipoteichoic acid biosynthesis protein DltD n=1 Tax=Streptococcus pneumoniae TaxID=1313 RepID=UPI0005E8FC4C|nr:D-alanyl-lipoteichoic acid biosynthesis protein DltD [Streptococcus pneumoniae]COH91128.1 protein involved in D-alanine esterification of lipoteichoic acid and wall teichoic acid (D-alanine transfer protein) [Streptococcus pneumoniae]